jgi:hypothetical protein
MQMMKATDFFRINTPTVVHETIDGETVIMNLDSGNYYSLTETGVKIVDLLVPGASVGDLVKQVGDCYQGNAGEIAQAVEAFVAELLAEGILVPGPGTGVPPEPQGGRQPVATAAKSEFKPPVLNKYSDMQELLLLDPIHEVDATGWPSSKPL